MAEMELKESCFNLTWRGGNWDRRTNNGVWRWGGRVRRKAWIKTIDIFLLGVMFVLCLTGCYGSPRDLLGINEYHLYRNGAISEKLDPDSDDGFMFDSTCETKRGLRMGDSIEEFKKLYGNVAIFTADGVSTVADEIDNGRKNIYMTAGCIKGKWMGYEKFINELRKMRDENSKEFYLNRGEDGEKIYFQPTISITLNEKTIEFIMIRNSTLVSIGG